MTDSPIAMRPAEPKKNKAGRGITFFTIPKPFAGHVGIIQRNAIKSWLHLGTSSEILLFGNDPSVAEAAREFGIRYSPELLCNSYGTPLINDCFERAHRLAAHDLLCYLNADILLLHDFTDAVQRIYFKRFLMVARRWDIDMLHPLNFSLPDWDAELRLRVASDAALHAPTGIDVLLFTKGLWRRIPPFAVGRAMWDNWMIYRARAQGEHVIDATQAATIIHQNHSYAHLAQGKQEAWEGPEAERNRTLAGGYKNAFSILDATWILTHQSLSRPKTPEHVRRRKETWPVLHPRLHAVGKIAAGMCGPLLSIMRNSFYTLVRRARFFLK